MTAINFDQDWVTVTSTTTGDGVITKTAGTLNCSSTAGSNSKVSKAVYLRPGETIRFSCLARLISGTGPIGGLSVVNSTRNRVYIESNDWELIEVTYTLPLSSSDAKFITFDIGIFTTESGEAEFTNPMFELYSCRYSANRTVASGLIGIAAGAPTVHSGFTSNGIKSLSYNASLFELSVTIPRSSGAVYSSPLFFCQTNGGGVAAAADIVAKQTSYDPVSGVVKIKFYSTVTNAFIDVTSIASMFMFFKAEIN